MIFSCLQILRYVATEWHDLNCRQKIDFSHAGNVRNRILWFMGISRTLTCFSMVDSNVVSSACFLRHVATGLSLSIVRTSSSGIAVSFLLAQFTIEKDPGRKEMDDLVEILCAQSTRQMLPHTCWTPSSFWMAFSEWNV